MSSYGAKGTRTPNNRLQRTVRYAAPPLNRSDGIPTHKQGVRKLITIGLWSIPYIS